MKIINLTQDTKTIYTANAYLVMSDWKAVADITVLIDTGQDPAALYKILQTNTGLGKRKIDKVILTHNHSDHAALLPEIMRDFQPEVYAFCKTVNGVVIPNQLIDGQFIKVADMECEVYHISAHSFDSVCIYCEREQVLFTGDNKFPLVFDNTELEHENFAAMFRLSKKDVRTVYPGHGCVQTFESGKFKVFNN